MVPRAGETRANIGEFDLRNGSIQAILNGAANVVKRTDNKAADPNKDGVVRLTFSGSHLYTGATRILAGRLLFTGSVSGSILVVENNNTHDIAGAEQSWLGVRLISGRIIDSAADGNKGRPDRGQQRQRCGKRRKIRLAQRHG